MTKATNEFFFVNKFFISNEKSKVKFSKVKLPIYLLIFTYAKKKLGIFCCFNSLLKDRESLQYISAFKKKLNSTTNTCPIKNKIR